MTNMPRIFPNINNVFLTAFCFFPLITALFRNAIYFYFYLGIAWIVFLLCRDSLKKTILDLWKYGLSTPFFLFLGTFALYIAFNFYLVSPYKSPTFGLQFLPFHVTSSFGAVLLYIANKERFTDTTIMCSLSSSVVFYLLTCCVYISLNPPEAELVLRRMLPFLFFILSCLLAVAVYKHFGQKSQKTLIILTIIILINGLITFVSEGNATKLIFIFIISIMILAYFFRRILFVAMNLALLFAVVLPVSVAKIQDFTILNSKAFDEQIRSVQTRVPQWMIVLDKFFEKPITGHGVFASYYVTKKKFIKENKENQELLNQIVHDASPNSITKDNKTEKRDKLLDQLRKIFKSYFLIERTNQYYNLKINIADPVYWDKFVQSIKKQSLYIEDILKILQESKDLELNIALTTRIKDQIELFQAENFIINKFLTEYYAANTKQEKQFILNKELERFFEYPQFQINNHPHNLFLQILFELGMVGLILFLSLLFFILYKIAKISDLFYKTVAYIIFFIFVIIYSTMSSLWYIDIHQIIYITAFLFLINITDQK